MLLQEQKHKIVTTNENKSELDSLLSKVNMKAPQKPFDQNNLPDDAPTNEYVTAGVRHLIDKVLMPDAQVDKIDQFLLDSYITEIDNKIEAQLNKIIEHPEFKEVEKTWKGIKFTVERSDHGLELLNYPKKLLIEDFEDAPSIEKSGLYKHIYTKAFDQPGAIPYTYMAADYQFNNSSNDIQLLKNISKVAASAHCLFFSSVDHNFFGFKSSDDMLKENLNKVFDQHEFIKWNSLRSSDESRYIGLVLNRFLLRLPYGEDNKVKSFNFKEDVLSDSENYLWGNPVYAFIANINKAFDDKGWGLNIIGPENGGKVENLPVHIYKTLTGSHKRIPTEILMSDTKEYEFAKSGFIPLVVYENQDFAVFFSAQSIQKATGYYDDHDTANAKLAANIPYMLLLSRIAHYLKIKLRETTGKSIDPEAIKNGLTRWLNNLKSERPDNTSKRPLKNFNLEISSYDDSPGYYHIMMSIEPHIQLKGVHVNLKLVAQLNKKKE